MAFLFKRNPKTPQDLIRALNEQIAKLDLGGDNIKKYQDECARYLKQIKVILHGDDENDPQPDQISLLAHEVYSTDCLYNLIYNLKKLDFDSRKDVVILFSTLLRRQIGNASPTVEYLINGKPEILIWLIKGPESSETGLVCGQILRDCIKFEVINRFILVNPLFWNYFKYVQSPVFEIATDAFVTLHDLVTTHKKLVSEFLANNYDNFTTSINQLIQSNNYVTKRQSVRLLAELVLQRQNQYFLNRYFDDTNNLKLIMLLLSNKSKNLQIEGFHIFKFFVAKPKKSQRILDILIKNKENFIAFFQNFNITSFNDSNLIDERDYILTEIQKLPDIERIN
ncbi:Piso0_000244 [Millerozyma farinosa CBS 7064]|uniref:Piso0_000244 protein n=1 Tax=Pichia sorbitophila (strain ATCC MYA-4447 / BCRC 22081 / CBS 7064 / NBRC 10061 / NRRL Y-12695) TaxID=559304 RepID=G8YUX1_PICSO|nr:Piso0_000244 [Millerozyma farinosa CBS 7064]